MSHLDSVAELNIGNEHSAILPSNTNSLWFFHKTSFVTLVTKNWSGLWMISLWRRYLSSKSIIKRLSGINSFQNPTNTSPSNIFSKYILLPRLFLKLILHTASRPHFSMRILGVQIFSQNIFFYQGYFWNNFYI